VNSTTSSPLLQRNGTDSASWMPAKLRKRRVKLLPWLRSTPPRFSSCTTSARSIWPNAKASFSPVSLRRTLSASPRSAACWYSKNYRTGNLAATPALPFPSSVPLLRTHPYRKDVLQIRAAWWRPPLPSHYRYHESETAP